MEIFFAVINTLLLVALFVYQRQKNRVLSDALAAQAKLVEETKSVVTQQATAIESQGKVVETALKYTAAFDPSKLEDLVRRELTIDHQHHLRKLQDDFERQLLDVKQSERQRLRDIVTKLTDTAKSAAAEATTEMIKPMVPIVLKAVIRMEPPERERALASLDPVFGDVLRSAIEQFQHQTAKLETS